MKNRGKYILTAALMLLPMVLNAVSVFFLPDKIPVHFGADNIVDRWGSKYEVIFIAALAIVIGAAALISAKAFSRKENGGKSNEKIMLVIGISLMTLYNIINLLLLYAAFNKVEDLNALPVNYAKTIFCAIGILFVIIGNIMPKAKMNLPMSWGLGWGLGLRTPWSCKNEKVWKKCQRFGGFSLIIAGLLIIIGAFVFEETVGLIWVISVAVLMSLIDTIYSYAAARKY